MSNRLVLFALSFLLTCSAFSQKLKKVDKLIFDNLKAHIGYLADDKLEGRRAGTNGEKLAREYISTQFQKIGLKPAGEAGGWFQPFDINDGKQINSATHLIINGNDLKLEKEYFPLSYSPNGNAEAAVEMALKEASEPWFLDIDELLEQNKDNPHFDLDATLKEKALKAGEKGATALIVFNSSALEDNLKFNGKDRSDLAKIPLFYITKSARKQYIGDESATYDVKLKADIGEKKRTGNNVVGLLDNGATSTIVIGAHYDHLGFGEDGNSMLRNSTEQLIHNGADDNASGTAAMIELARLMKASKLKSSNYVFIAFSAEELGLNGSKYFTEHPTVNLSSVNFMVNMDMVGRLNDSSKSLTVGGYGTSPVWSEVMKTAASQKYFNIRYDSSGSGPSDHTSFYRKDIPVLFLFTHTHSDYHRPSDDADKINYLGEVQIVKFVEGVVVAAQKKGKLAFTKTREAQSVSTTRFAVTMGIMPDYTFAGTGIRVDGVSDDRPAKKAGIQTGDIILQLGDFQTSSMETYMQALGKFKKGEKAKVKYKRGAESKEAEVVF